MSEQSKPVITGGISRYGRRFKVVAILPLLVIVGVLSIYPLIELLVMSVGNVAVQHGQRQWAWVGSLHYQRMLVDAGYWRAVINTLVYVVTSMGLEFVFGLSLALLTTKIKRGAAIYRTILLIPLLVPPIAVATSWRLMYNPNFGLFNRVAQLFDWSSQYWLSQPESALPAVIAVSIWYWTAYSFILLLAGLQNIPGELYESADIDGATSLQRFGYITLPLLKAAIAVTILFRSVNAFKVFDIVYALTFGGPGLSTEVINTYVYKVFIVHQRLGYGAALAIAAILIVGAVSLTYTRVFRVERGLR